jgi:predicted RNase H-like nuclease (RuvC/YqgF family)
MTNKINMLEHDNNVLAHQNFSQQIKITRLEGELEKVKAERDDEIARVKVLRKVWDQTTRDLVKAEDEVKRLDHALDAANQALYVIDRG